MTKTIAVTAAPRRSKRHQGLEVTPIEVTKTRRMKQEEDEEEVEGRLVQHSTEEVNEDEGQEHLQEESNSHPIEEETEQHTIEDGQT